MLFFAATRSDSSNKNYYCISGVQNVGRIIAPSIIVGPVARERKDFS